MFKKRPKSQLTSFIFTDGSVESFVNKAATVTVAFKNYASSISTIQFDKIVRVAASPELLDEYVVDSELKFADGHWTLQLLNDEGHLLLDIEFDDAAIKENEM